MSLAKVNECIAYICLSLSLSLSHSVTVSVSFSLHRQGLGQSAGFVPGFLLLLLLFFDGYVFTYVFFKSIFCDPKEIGFQSQLFH